jgi:glycosyltransferase involved in cell wall biosynthesis
VSLEPQTGLREGPALLSVVVPIYNEEGVIPELYRRLTAALAERYEYELILVDDGSSDRSWQQLLAASVGDRRVRLVRLSRNFGHQPALSAGMDRARGDAIVLLDGDLQDPPELIPDLVAKWREGYDVVYAVRADREVETVFKRTSVSLFYRLMSRLADSQIPEQAGDFRLLSRRAADAIAQMPERARFLRGMAAWIGFRQVGVPYRREARFAGSTKYPVRKLFKLALDGITSFSTKPLRLISAVGFLTVLLCFGYLVYALYERFFTHEQVRGWTSVIVVVLLLGGVQLLSLGVVGQYIARIFDEAKGRPLYLIDELVETPHGGGVAADPGAELLEQFGAGQRSPTPR